MSTPVAGQITRIRTPEQIEAASALVWEFFDFLRDRYPEMHDVIDAYVADQDVSGELADFGAFFMPPNGEAFLALHDGAPAGLVLLKSRGAGDCEMNRMFVRGSARGSGLGRKLGQALIAEARALGYRTIYLDALYRHVEALPLYESLGFRRYIDPQGFAGDDARVIHMKLET